jgi:probable F420-dependent oxidoreductase
MKFSVNLPIDHIEPAGAFQTMEAVREIAAALDKSRVYACYLTDHPAPSADWLHNTAGGHDALDPFAGLAFIASLTDRVRLMTNIIVLPYRSPFITAKSAATLQVLSGGRFILGVAAGYQKVEFDALGVPHSERGMRTDEALELIRLAWAGGPVVKKGRFFDAAENESRPVPSPAPPIWVGGGSEKAAERAARWGDAWVPVYFPVIESNRVTSGASAGSLDDLKAKMARVRELRGELGKTGPFEFAASTSLLPKSVDRADVGKYRDAVDAMDKLGLSCLNLSLYSPSRAAYLENLAWLSEEIIPHFPDHA